MHFIQDSVDFICKGVEATIKSKKLNPRSALFSMAHFALLIIGHLGIHSKDSFAHQSLQSEIEFLLKTGDLIAKVGKVVCVNPTLLSLEDKIWQVIHHNCFKRLNFIFSDISIYLNYAGIWSDLSLRGLLSSSFG